MPASLDPLKRALLRLPRELLLALADEAKRAKESDRPDFAAGLPRVRIDTVWRLSYEGRVLGLEVQGGSYRVLFAPETPAGTAPALSYLDLIEPFQLTVYDAPAHARLFRFGEPARWSTDAPPGALELKRILARVREELAQAGLTLEVEDALGTDRGSANAVVRDVVLALPTFVEQIRRDEVGREALAAVRTLRLRFATGTALRATRSGDVLELVLDPAEGLGERTAFEVELAALL